MRSLRPHAQPLRFRITDRRAQRVKRDAASFCAETDAWITVGGLASRAKRDTPVIAAPNARRRRGVAREALGRTNWARGQCAATVRAAL